MKIAYLINQYPKVSHSFIRREILGVEACGIEIARFSIRGCDPSVVDEADKEEATKTRYVLQAGILGLGLAFLRTAIARPIAFLKSLQLTLKVGRRSDRGLPVHFIYLAEACLLLQWFTEAAIAHVHVHFGTNPATVAMLCQALGGPSFSFTVHGPEEFDRGEAIALTEKLHRAAFAVAISSFGKSQLLRRLDYKEWSKVKVVHCGVDDLFLHQPFTPIPAEPRMVCVGRLCEQKAQLLLVEAAGQLAAEGHAFKLILVGDGSLRPPLEAMIAHLGLQNQVEITGWASGEEVQRQILSAQVKVLPSFAEGLPVVLMEALALARPVISTYIAGIPELVEPGVCGWLIPAGSVEALTEAMREALNTPIADLERMGKIGSDRVRQEHDALVEAAKLVECFKQSTAVKNG